MYLTIASLLADESESFNPLDPSFLGVALWTWIIFLVALPFIWKIVMGPVTQSMEARDQRATQAVAAAEEAKRGAEKARSEVEARLTEAQAEAARMVEAARTRAEARERELIAEAGKESAAMLEAARAEIQNERNKAVAQIRKQVVDLSIAAAGQVLKRRVDASDDRRLVEELVAAREPKS
jgi:F-type H+-transporting ATPase subunit b